jgi:hypothetical protein
MGKLPPRNPGRIALACAERTPSFPRLTGEITRVRGGYLLDGRGGYLLDHRHGRFACASHLCGSFFSSGLLQP